MDEARVITTGDVITGEELYLMDDVDSTSFCCDECEIILIPCSYIKDVNLRKPYFKTHKGHNIGCKAEGISGIKKKGFNSRLTSKEGFPLAYPNKFKLRKDDVVIPEPVTPESPSGVRTFNKNKRQDDEGRGRKSNYETSSFKSIVNQYFDFPKDRDRALFFENIEGATYKDIFYPIRNTIGEQHYRFQGEGQNVYFSTISWKKSSIDNDILRIELSRGKWVNKKNERAYYLEIDCSEWPRQTKTKFLNRYHKILDTVRGTKIKAAIIFVGEQDRSDDFFRFYANNRLLIAFKLFNDA